MNNTENTQCTQCHTPDSRRESNRGFNVGTTRMNANPVAAEMKLIEEAQRQIKRNEVRLSLFNLFN